jgi:uncharacterized iron-regulated membrane protein
VLEYWWHEVLGTVHKGILLRFVILAAICGVVMWFARSSAVKRKPPGAERLSRPSRGTSGRDCGAGGSVIHRGWS